MCVSSIAGAGRRWERVGVAELPELWTAPTPEPDTRKPPRERGPFLTYLLLPWSYGDGDSGERWHRVQCFVGRHGMGGGHTMQVDGEVVFIERRCRWCGAGPKAL